MITFVHGVMGSGKSSMAITLFYETPGSLLLSGGDRLPGRVSSRDGRSVASTELSYLKMHREFIINTYTTVIVDECQFLHPEDIFYLRDLSLNGLSVVLFGLKTSYLNKVFPAIETILSIADIVEEIEGNYCWCGDIGTTHGRICGDKMLKAGNPCIKDTILETFDEFYVVLCDDHWESGQWCANIPVCR